MNIIVANALKYSDSTVLWRGEQINIDWRKLYGFEDDNSNNPYYLQAKTYRRIIEHEKITLDEVEAAILKQKTPA